MRYRSLDGLRGMAALTVVVSHFSNETDFAGSLLGWGGGQIGVMLFFCLSGFLMGRLYLDETPSVSAVLGYFRRRVARVVPLYLAVVAVSYWWWNAHGSPWPFYRVNASNLLEHLLFWRGVDVLWTIPVEVQFYLVFPLLWALGYRSKRALLAALLILTVAVALMRFPTVPGLLEYLPFFLAGVAVSQIDERPGFRGSDVAFALGVMLYVLSFPQILKAIGLPAGNPIPALTFKAPWFSPFYLVLVPGLLWISLCSRLASRTLGSQWAVFIGMISYSIYLLHYVVLRVVTSFPPLKHHPALTFPFFLAAVLLLAWLSYRYLEAPLRSAISGRKVREIEPQPA